MLYSRLFYWTAFQLHLTFHWIVFKFFNSDWIWRNVLSHVLNYNQKPSQRYMSVEIFFLYKEVVHACNFISWNYFQYLIFSEWHLHVYDPINKDHFRFWTRIIQIDFEPEIFRYYITSYLQLVLYLLYCCEFKKFSVRKVFITNVKISFSEEEPLHSTERILINIQFLKYSGGHLQYFYENILILKSSYLWY